MGRRSGDRVGIRSDEAIGQTYDASPWLACLSSDGSLNRPSVAHRSESYRDPEGWGHSFDRGVEHWGGSPGVRVEDDGHPSNARCDLLQQLQPLPHDRRIPGAEPGKVAARSRDALNKALPDGIDHKYKNDRYRVGLLPQDLNYLQGACENCVWRQTDQFRCIGFEESRITRGKAEVDPNILTLDPAETLQRQCKGG